MFIIRTAFWLMLIVLLLPSNEQEQREVYGTAQAAVNDIKTFCVRNPGVCETSTVAFESFSQKAQFGAKMLMDFMKDASSDVAAMPIERDQRQPGPVSMFRRESNNTLTADDLKVAWTAPNT